MVKRSPSKKTAKWFFILVSVGILYLFWRVIEPFALLLITAGIFSVVLSPLDTKIKKKIKNKQLAVLVLLLIVFILFMVPLFILGILVVQQASDVLTWSLGQTAWFEHFDPSNYNVFYRIPEVIREKILTIDFVAASNSIAEWVFSNLGNAFSKGVSLIFGTFIFFITLYYFLVDKERIYQFMLDMSPLKDKLDSEIVDRIAKTVRSVVFGSLIIAVVQAILATIAMLVLGVPGALLWGSLIVIAAQVPIFGVGIVLIPATLYLGFSGSIVASIILGLWSFFVVGLSDNFLRPILLGKQTNMPELWILVSVLGGLELFGSIGIILGPTILASVLVVIDLYKSGILEN